MPLRLLKRIFSFFNGLAVLALLLAYSAVFINPRLTVIPAFFGLAFPLIFLVNLIFVLVWLMYSPWKILFSGVAILLGVGYLSNYVQIGRKDSVAEVNSKEKLKVLSYNVRLFDLYNWTNNLNTRNKIFKLLDKENADILCFQEFFYAKKKGDFDTRDTLIQFLKVPYVHEGYTHKTSHEHYFGLATFSKYPMVNRGEIVFESDPNNLCIFSDIKIGQDTVRIYNAHLSSIRLQKEDYQWIKRLGGKAVKGVGEQEGAMFRRIKTAFIKRTEQTNKILNHIKQCPFPKLVCGDFNDSPMSYCYGKFSDELIDAFKESGVGIGNTYVGIFPSLRIDYIFHDTTIKSSNFRIIQEELSDHLPQVVDVWLKK